jgi:hypothetical protein
VAIDNASVHNKLVIEQLLQPTGCRIIYAAAYSPYYHPTRRKNIKIPNKSSILKREQYGHGKLSILEALKTHKIKGSGYK